MIALLRHPPLSSARLAVGLALLSALAVDACAQNVRTIRNNGPTDNRYDLVILGDGYQAFEESRFDADALAVTNHLFSVAPYSTFAQSFNVHTVFRASTQSGANHPDTGVYNNPVYGASYNTGGTPRCLYITNTGLALADAALAPSSEGRVMVLVNDSRYGGCGGTFAVSYNGSQMTEVQAHEFGHSFGGLADEYGGSSATYTGPEPGERNVTKDATGQKWSAWLGSNGIGVFQGARYYNQGLYRPWNDCLMRSLNRPLCSVCREQISLTANSAVSAIDQPLPASQNITLDVSAPPQAFSFSNLSPAGNNPQITWTLDGQTVATATTNYTLDPATAPLGSHVLRAEVLDQTALVRNDPTNLMRHQHSWNVQVVDASAPDLYAEFLGTSSFSVGAGGTVDLTTTVRNPSPNPAGAFRVDHFLSTDSTIDSSDIYLGGYTVSGLAAGQADVRTRSAVRLPSYLVNPVYVVGVLVDRENLVREQDESNNVRTSAFLVAAPPCPPVLEYRDALLYPRDAAVVPLATGGSALPTVVARCAAPGTSYLLVWGCSGTNPGTPIGSGLVVPLNQDYCTAFSLADLNGSVFVQSFGVLDANGHGNAEFRWPPGLGPLPMTGHFAAVLIDSTPAFSAVTPPIAITIQ